MRQRAVITGGSRGIGKSIVRSLATDGWSIRFCYHSNDAAAQDLVDELNAVGSDVAAARCDVADHDAVAAWIADVEREGAIDAVVNSAGITRDRAFVSMAAADWRDVIDTNLSGTFNVCRAAAFGMMKRRRGSIVNLSSVSGVFGNPGQANYAASKAGIIGLSRTLAKELGGFGLRVNVVAPGLIDTDMTAAAGLRLEKLVRTIPLGRMGRADDVAAAVSFLMSDAAGYVTGQVLGVDGGLVI